MPYFYYWDGRRKNLHSHPGEFVLNNLTNDYRFETTDGSGKHYLHCKPDGTTYSRTQIILQEKDDLLAIESLIDKTEKIIANQNKDTVTKVTIKSLAAMKDYRDKLKNVSPIEKKEVGCEFCTTNTDKREMIADFDLNLGIIGTVKVYTFIEGEKESFLNTIANLETSSDTCEDLGWDKRRIKYCPMCGRKLKKEG